MTRVHPVAARGFAAAADAYERARPTYAAAAVEWLAQRTGLAPGVTAIDLGAGTGKLTRALVATGACVVAVEPIDGMRAKLREVLPEVEALDGTAEAIPVANGSADLVAAGQAFHWFDMEQALPEIHRVLRPDGRLGLLWNSRDLAHPLLGGIEALLDPHVPENLSRMGRMEGWREAIAGSPLFGAYEHKTFDNPHRLTRDGLRDRLASTSFVAAMDEPAQSRLLDEAVALADGLEEPFDFPYVTDVFVFPRSGDGS